jgi:hypothetical protein
MFHSLSSYSDHLIGEFKNDYFPYEQAKYYLKKVPLEEFERYFAEEIRLLASFISDYTKHLIADVRSSMSVFNNLHPEKQLKWINSKVRVYVETQYTINTKHIRLITIRTANSTENCANCIVELQICSNFLISINF